MSLCYSILTIGLGASQAHHSLGSLWGRAAPASVRVFSVFNALGQMAFGEQGASRLLLLTLWHEGWLLLVADHPPPARWRGQQPRPQQQRSTMSPSYLLCGEQESHLLPNTRKLALIMCLVCAAAVPAAAYGCAVVQLEVQDTLKEPPGEVPRLFVQKPARVQKQTRGAEAS
jgi:hypothetical protein